MHTVLNRINKSAIKFLEPLLPSNTYAIVVEEAMKLIDADYGSIFLKKGSDLDRVYASNPVLFNTVIRKRGYTYSSFKQNKAFVVHKKKTSIIHANVDELGINSTIFIPLVHDDDPIGVISIDSKKEKFFSKSQLETMKLFGSLASLAILKALAYEKQSQALTVRDRFISMASHELRTPLTAVKGYSALIKSRIDTNKKIPAEWPEKLNSEIERLTTIIFELLDLNNVKKGTMVYLFQEVNIIELIKTSVSIMQKVHPNRVIKLINKTSESISIVADPNKLTQVFTNVLENAVKFSPNQMPIEIRIQKAESLVIILISDKGIGIHPKDLPHIFEEHYQADTANYEGMGIGLFLAKSIVTKHNGKIRLFSTPHSGTKVEIKLPVIQYDY